MIYPAYSQFKDFSILFASGDGRYSTAKNVIPEKILNNSKGLVDLNPKILKIELRMVRNSDVIYSQTVLTCLHEKSHFLFIFLFDLAFLYFWSKLSLSYIFLEFIQYFLQRYQICCKSLLKQWNTSVFS